MSSNVLIGNGSPSFSVVVPVYNAERYLARCIASLLKQTFVDFEVIFVDDGSRDGSRAIIREQKDPRIRLVTQENRGVSAARNAGIRHSTRRYIAFLDADDEWEPKHLETMADLIIRFPEAGIYTTGVRLLYEDGTPPVEIQVDTVGEPSRLIENPFPLWSVGAVSNCSNTALPRGVLDEVGMFKEGEAENEDMDLWVRIGVKYPLAASSAVTSIYHQVPTAGKPRFRKWPSYILSCKTASGFLAVEKDILRIDGSSIRAYIRGWIRIYFWSLVHSNARDPLKTLLNNSNARAFAPMYHRMANAAIAWPLLRAYSKVRRLLNSRLVLRMRGGTKRKNGVVIRIVDDARGAWASYIRRERPKRTADCG